MIANFMLSGLIVFLTLTAPALGHKKETGNEGGTVTTVTVDRRYNVLDFGKTTHDYVMMRLNMQPLQRAFSVCSWLKKRRADGQYPTWFDYSTSAHAREIVLSDDGRRLYIHNMNVDMSSKFTAALGSWFHQCMTWSTARGRMSVYVNGDLAGTGSVSSSALELSGVVVLGYSQGSPGRAPHSQSYMFGGELYKLNVYAKELTAAEVKEMAEGGFCSEVEVKYGLTRYLKWEDILLQERNGNVTEQDSGCHKPTPPGPGPTSTSRWEVLKSDTFYNKILTHELVDELRASWKILEDFIGTTVDDGFIRHFKSFHDENTDAGDD